MCYRWPPSCTEGKPLVVRQGDFHEITDSEEERIKGCRQELLWRESSERQRSGSKGTERRKSVAMREKGHTPILPYRRGKARRETGQAALGGGGEGKSCRVFQESMEEPEDHSS